jgi:pyruvate formate lyase activating enzyme
VVVGGLNDTEENVERLRELVSSKTCVKKIELLPFKKICTQKYESLNIPFPFAQFHEPTKDVMTKLNQCIEKN